MLGNFFSPFPGHTGKINLPLATAGTHHLPEAFFGLHKKTEHGQVKILILPFFEEARLCFKIVFHNYRFLVFCAMVIQSQSLP